MNISSWAHRRTNVMPLSRLGQRRWEYGEILSRAKLLVVSRQMAWHRCGPTSIMRFQRPTSAA